MKRCTRCDQVKDWSEFYTIKTSPYFKPRPHPWCKECKRAYDRSHIAEARRRVRLDAESAHGMKP